MKSISLLNPKLTISRNNLHIKRCLYYVAVMAVLSGCGTGAYNELVAQDRAQLFSAYQAAVTAHAQSCSSSLASCDTDVCRVAAVAICNASQSMPVMPSAGQYRSAAQDFNLVASPIVNGVVGLGQLGVSAISIIESNKTARFTQESQQQTTVGIVDSLQSGNAELFGAFGGVLGDGLNAFSNLPATTAFGDGTTIVDNGGTFVDGGSTIGDTRRDTATSGGVIGNGNRQNSPDENNPVTTTTENPDPIVDTQPPGVGPINN